MRPRNGEQPDSMSDRGAGPRPFFLRFTAGRRFCLLHAPERRAIGAVLYVHPLAEEMNKSRRMAALQARALAASGWFVLQVDLFGCGDSDGDFGDADWQRWLADVDEARGWLRGETGQEPVLWGLRAGCLLATEAAARASERVELVLWQPVISGRQHLTQWLRLNVAGRLLDASAADRSGTQALQARFARGETVEIAGYRIAAALAAGLESADLAPPPPLPTLPGTAEQAVDTALANNPDLQSINEQIRAAGFDDGRHYDTALSAEARFAAAAWAATVASLSRAAWLVKDREKAMLSRVMNACPSASSKRILSASSVRVNRAFRT